MDIKFSKSELEYMLKFTEKDLNVSLKTVDITTTLNDTKDLLLLNQLYSKLNIIYHQYHINKLK